MSESFAPNFSNLKIQTTYPTSNIYIKKTNFLQNPTQRYLTQATSKIPNSTINKITSTSPKYFRIIVKYQIIIVLGYKTLNARPSSGGNLQNLQNQRDQRDHLDDYEPCLY